MISAVLLAAAFTLSLFITNTASPFLGAWAVFFYSACFISVLNKPPLKYNSFIYLLIIWVAWVFFIAFFVRLTKYSPMFSMVLTSPAIYLLSVRDIESHLKAVSIPLILLTLFISYRWLAEGAGNHWWPFLNKNNAAAVVSMGLVGFVALGLRDNRYWLIVPVFVVALMNLECRTAYIAVMAGIGLLLVHDDSGYWLVSLSVLFVVSVCVFYLAYQYTPEYFTGIEATLQERFNLWMATVEIIKESPLFGTGLGSFTKLYPYYTDLPIKSAGFFAHNDPLQFGMELGSPAFILFYVICIAGIKYLCIEARAVLLTVVIETHMSYHFYMPSVMILVGVVLAAGYIYNVSERA